MNYSLECLRTLSPRPVEFTRVSENLLHGAFGLCTESGELQDALKRTLFYGTELDKTNLIEELGDIEWYLALIRTELDVSQEEVQQANLAKLRKRFPEKFTSEEALERDLEGERDAIEARTHKALPDEIAGDLYDRVKRVVGERARQAEIEETAHRPVGISKKDIMAFLHRRAPTDEARKIFETMIGDRNLIVREVVNKGEEKECLWEANPEKPWNTERAVFVKKSVLRKTYLRIREVESADPKIGGSLTKENILGFLSQQVPQAEINTYWGLLTELKYIVLVKTTPATTHWRANPYIET